MDSQAQPEVSLRDALPWVGMMLDYTDKVAALIPDDMIDWRPEDPSEAFCFSLGEIVMHCSDARLMFSRQLTGSDSKEGYWSEEPGEDGGWSFREHGGKQAILDSLASARREFDPWLDKPASAMTEIPDGAYQTYERALQWFKDNDQDPTDFECRGPANIVRVLMALAAHESGHRGALQTLLRLKGINVRQE